MESKELVIKANDLIEGFVDMNQNEYKFTLYLVSKIKKDDKELQKQTVTVQEFADVLGVQTTWLYTYLEEFENKLLAKKIAIKYPNGDRLGVNWFSYIKYYHREGKIEVAFNHYLSPYLLQLDIPYTKYFLDNIKNLDSIHALRLYELLKQYENIGSRKFDVDILKQMMGHEPTMYPNYFNFKLKVLKKAQDEINAKTDITFEFIESKKIKKKVVEVTFKIYPKNKNMVIEAEKQVKEVEQPSSSVYDVISAFKTLYDGELMSVFVSKMIEKTSIEHVQECLITYEDYIQGRNPSNKGADFYSYVTKGYENTSNSKKSKPQYANFDQRDYSDDYFEKFYVNVNNTEKK